MLSPRYPAAVAAGNVETSQTIVNCLYGALGVLGSAQGTMNNLTFGNQRAQYYETICSGAPAGPRLRRRGGGADAHDQFAAHRPRGARASLSQSCSSASRSGAGLAAKANGAPATGRFASFRFLERMECAILSGFRRMRPFGTKGGEPGESGANSVRRKDGRMESLEGLRASDPRSRRRHHHQDADRRRLRRSTQIERARDCSRALLRVASLLLLCVYALAGFGPCPRSAMN